MKRLVTLGRCRVLAAGLLIAAPAAGLLAGSASAETPKGAPITFFSALPSTPQAGGHPDLETWFEVENSQAQRSQSACECEDAKNAAVHLPAGFIGNPHATPQCSSAEFSSETCAVDSQVGVVHVCVPSLCFDSAVYNLVPPPEVSGLLGFKVYGINTPQFTVLSARTGSDYGLDATATSIFHGLGSPLVSLQQDLWGVPAESSHDPLRFKQGVATYSGDLCDASGSFSTADPNTIVKPCVTNGTPPSVPSNSPSTPFLQNPTTCTGATSSGLDVLSYDGVTNHADSAWPQMTGCDQLSFNPSLYAQPTTNETDTASGIDINLKVPQQLSPSIPSPTELRGATVTLPAGFSINPNAASGKTACTDADANFGTTEAANCPEFSKVGSLEIESSALPGPLPGYVYLGQPVPGNRYRIFLVADGFATHIKLAGTVTPNAATGQLTITFDNLPQTPLTEFKMHFFGSERGLMATPTQCGTYPVETLFTPWDAALAPQSSTQFFTLESGPNGAPCPGPRRPFDPGFQAESESNTAGAHSPFSIELTRNDGEQNLAGVSISTPPGLIATLAGIPYCSDPSLTAAADPNHSGLEEEAYPSCPLASQVGTSVAGAGAGNHPLYIPGRVYLAGPYKGAPLSLAVITPAISGPYDLGNVVVRVALHVDPTDAHITAVSDPLPQILQGIPLRLREIRVNLDREGFALNPTNCDPFQVKASVLGDQGAQSELTNHYQVGNCATLNFAPKLALSFTGSTVRAGNPALRATLTANPGEANVARVQTTLPHSEQVDNAHIRNPCTRVQFAEGKLPGEKCPAGSDLGFAKAETPLLEKPLEGHVYLRSNGGERKLPDLVAALNGQIDVALIGHVESIRGRLRTTFETVPDAPVSRFVLNLYGGKKGLLANSTDLCSAPQEVLVELNGQNGATYNQNQKQRVPCGSRARRSHLQRKRRRG
jgi:hypothetical protein